ncbi:DUF1631 domain-containing protein [Massilia sp. PAMC28688]|uniref:DUF1631 family protein n=1 Tax=Massilia sp. PAMC28688 TaxID=2861283 RepID=UPI001C62D243|nr:DUF1631 family protein [Massilia sp. PAMC28688]QYF92882.1 DUF1631 domain-containing protein [Massilia sp. PAMC28688]
MAPVASKPANAQKAAVSQHELLEALVEIVTKHANEQWLGVGTRLVSALLDVADPSMDARDVFLRVKSGNLLKEHSYAFLHLISEELEKSLRAEVAGLTPRPRATLISEAALTLVPFAEMDNRVAFDALSRPFEMKYATQIATLNVRLGYLLNRDILRLAQNPFRPELFLAALSSAWREFEPNEEAHGLITRLLRPEILFDLGPMYDALCDALVNKGTQPGSMDAYNIKKTECANAAKAKRAKKQEALAQQLRQFLTGEADSEFDAGIPLIPNLPQSTGGPGGWRPSAVHGFVPEPAAAQSAPVHGAAPHAMAAGASPFHGVQGGTHGFAAAGPGGPNPGGPFPGGPFPGGPIPDGPIPGGQFHSQVMAGGLMAQVAFGTSPQPHAATGAVLGQAGFGAAPAPLLDMLKTLQARMPEQFAATPSTPGAAQNADVFYLPRLKASIPQGSLSRGDESTIDLLSKIFDTVFLDPNIPKEIRELIQFLQIPVLKAALADKNFFFEEAHPARRMINLLTRLGPEQRSADDPLFQAMQRSVDKVGREEGQGDAAFASAVAELEDSIKAEESFEVEAIAAPIAAALKQEKVTAATRSAKSAVAARVSSGEVVAVLETFLEKKWTSVLTLAYTLEDEKPGAVGSATRTMDDLIWSVKPKITHEERRSLIAKLPTLLATLNKWLDIIQWQEADRLQFFAELAECHASIVRAPLDITPERQLEIAVEVAQEDAMRRLQKEKAAEQQPEQQIDAAAVTVEALERGAWMEFTQNDGTVRLAKLAWVSPLKTLYIFSVGARKESFSLSVEKLTAGVRQKKVSLVRTEGVVERALFDAMGVGAINDTTVMMDVAA